MIYIYIILHMYILYKPGTHFLYTFLRLTGSGLGCKDVKMVGVQGFTVEGSLLFGEGFIVWRCLKSRGFR